MKKSNKRREALKKLAKSALELSAATAPAVVSAEEKKKVKLLTADGKLVEIDADVLASKGKKKPTSNTDILDWTNQVKT